jgi:hypothetical protein
LHNFLNSINFCILLDQPPSSFSPDNGDRAEVGAMFSKNVFHSENAQARLAIAKKSAGNQ